MEYGATVQHDGLQMVEEHGDAFWCKLMCVSVCVLSCVYSRTLSIDFLFLEVSRLIFPFSLSRFLPPRLLFSPSLQSLRNALNVLIFAHANTRVSQQQRLNSSADPRQTDHTTHWHLDSLQTKWIFLLLL